jgi:hypothetical protein
MRSDARSNRRRGNKREKPGSDQLTRVGTPQRRRAQLHLRGASAEPLKRAMESQNLSHSLRSDILE